MDNNETAMVSIDTDGNVLKCAKGLGMGECGYKAGMEVCGKCGAMAVRMKMIPIEEMVDEDMVDDEDDAEKMPDKKKAKRMVPSMTTDEDAEEEEVEEEEVEVEAMAEEEANTDEVEVDENPEEESAEEEAQDEDEEEDEEMPDMEKMKKMRSRRLASMGMKSGDAGETGYMCSIDRKVYPGSQSVCNDCPGGCVAEKGMPGIIEVEGIVEEMFDSKAFDSGYSADDDLFVVHAERKDGKSIEVIVHATTAEVLGFKVMNDEETEEKQDEVETDIIGFLEAADIAVKSIDGEVLAVEADFFEGEDAYAVEIDGFDGKSYDVYVGLDGEILGYDKYEPEDAEEIEAEAAEIALKRAFSEERRMELAEEGMALPDGSYPIVSEEDLRNAVQAFGRAKDKEKAKLHIIKRAKEMGKEELLPENWMSSEKTEEAVEEKASDESDAAFLAAIAEFQILESEIDSI
jgi:uncharacterized membrane protein YkoI